MHRLLPIFRPLMALIIGLSLGSLITVFVGENPLAVLGILVHSAVGSTYDVGMSLSYATPLIFTGLSVAFALRGGLFNIGAEGQLTMGALAAVAVGILYPDIPSPWGVLWAMGAAALAGAAWAGIAGLLKAGRGSHEVITTIMLNFIATGISSYIILNVLNSPHSASPESRLVGDGYRLPIFPHFDIAPVSWALPIALLVALLCIAILQCSGFGFRLRATGANPSAAAATAMNVPQIYIGTMALAGALAGLAGLSDVLGVDGQYRLGFSGDYGFTGIAVALLGRSHPVGVVLAALLFGCLQKGAIGLDFSTEHVTRDLAVVMQACVILSVCADGLWDYVYRCIRPTSAVSIAGERAKGAV